MATNLKQKSTDARRHRRTRLKRAMLPIIELLGCTQMGAADAVKGVFAENHRLISSEHTLQEAVKTANGQIESAKRLHNDLTEALAAKDVEIAALKSEIQDFVLRRDELSHEIDSKDSEIKRFADERDRLVSVMEKMDTEIAELKIVIRDLRIDENASS